MRWPPGIRLLATVVAVLNVCQLLNLSPTSTWVNCLPVLSSQVDASIIPPSLASNNLQSRHLPSSGDEDDPPLKRPVRLAVEDKDGDGKPDKESEAPAAAKTAKDDDDDDPKPGPTLDEEKKEAVDEDLTSDEEKHDDDGEDDDDDDKDTNTEPANNDDDDDDDDVKSQADHKLLVILVDGFRHDYVARDLAALKGFPRLAKGGVYAKEVTPVHPADSYPNWYSILTGLYPESHGMTANTMRDRASGMIFHGSPHPNASEAVWWTGAEPLWWTAERHRVKTAVYGWDGCQVRVSPEDEVDVKGKRMRKKRPPPLTFCEPYSGHPGTSREKERFRGWLETITEDFKEHKYRLAMAYYENVDKAGHRFGPQSKMTKQAVRDIDEILYDLQDMLTKKDLDDEVNVYVLSDHGMIDASRFRPIHLEAIVDFNDVELVLGAGATLQMLAERGKHAEVLNKLRQANVRGLNVYERSTIPERFHLRANARNLLPIFLTADKGYRLLPPPISGKVTHTDDNGDGQVDLSRGSHGYDPHFVEEMDGIMYAAGPDIKNIGSVIGEMDMVDHYGLLCQLLGLPARPHNGSSEMYDQVLSKWADDSSEEEEGVDKAGDDDDDGDNSKEKKEGDVKKKKDDDDDDDDDDENGAADILLATSSAQLLAALVFSLAFAAL